MKMGSNGGVRLPPGFRFHPTDEELVNEYLKRKVYNSPLPASVIPDFHVCPCDPWALPGEKGKERYFFSRREAKYAKGNRSNRATNSGYWKATGKDKHIVSRSSDFEHRVGMKKTLVFYKGKPPHGSRTHWIMHEYRLLHSSLTLKAGAARGDWVLCRIFVKKRRNAGNKNEEEEDEEEIINDEKDKKLEGGVGSPVFYDFMGKDTTKQANDANIISIQCSSSTGSSALTHISSNHRNNNNIIELWSEDKDDSSSCCNTTVSSSLSLPGL